MIPNQQLAGPPPRPSQKLPNTWAIAALFFSTSGLFFYYLNQKNQASVKDSTKKRLRAASLVKPGDWEGWQEGVTEPDKDKRVRVGLGWQDLVEEPAKDKRVPVGALKSESMMRNGQSVPIERVQTGGWEDVRSPGVQQPMHTLPPEYKTVPTNPPTSQEPPRRLV